MIVGKEDLSKLLGNLADQKTAQKALKQACAYVELRAKEKAPSNNGELRNSIISKVEGLTGEVGTNLEYAVYVHQGTGLYANGGAGREATGAHPIPWAWPASEEDVKKYGNDNNLSYGKDGQAYIWTKGQKANPFLEQAFDESKPMIRQIFQSVIKEATDDRL